MHYSVNDNARHDTILAETVAGIVDGIKTTLLAAGWTLVVSDGSQVVLTFTGLPANNQTCVFDGQTYKFVNALSAAFDVAIGADAAGCASNLAAAINDSGGEGVIYGTGTTEHATCTASCVAGVVTISAKTGGPATFTASESLSNATLDVTTSRYGGYRLKSGLNNAGHYFYLRVFDNTNSCGIQGYDATFTGATCYLMTGVSRYLELFASEVHLFTAVQGGVGIPCEAFQAALLFIKPPAMPVVISAVEDDGTGQIKVTTSAPHEMVTGDQVHIAYALGLTSINGYWNVTVIDPTHYVLDGSVYAAGYTVDSARSANRFQLSRAWFTLGQGFNTTQQTLRQLFAPTNGSSYSFAMGRWAMTMGSSFWGVAVMVPGALTGSEPVWNWGAVSDIVEAAVATRVANDANAWSYKMGDLYYAFVSRTAPQDEAVCPDFDGKSWYCYLTANNYSLWICRGNVA